MALPPPTQKVRERLRSAEDSHRGITGYHFHPHLGVHSEEFFSFAAVLRFLEEPDQRIDHEKLVQWVREVFGDEALADAMSSAIADHDCGFDRSCAIGELMHQRLLQCEE